MRLGPARLELESAGHEVVWAGDWVEDPGDEEILIRAHSEGRVLVTLHKDFGELAIVRGFRHSGLCDRFKLLRVERLSSRYRFAENAV